MRIDFCDVSQSVYNTLESISHHGPLRGSQTYCDDDEQTYTTSVRLEGVCVAELMQDWPTN